MINPGSNAKIAAGNSGYFFALHTVQSSLINFLL